MALFQKQNFTPTVLSAKWIAMQFRPNMLMYCREHVMAVLESGLLFREDSAEVEDDTVAWLEQEVAPPFLTGGEKVLSALALAAAVTLFPPKNLQRGCLARLGACVAAPLAARSALRWRCAGDVRALLRAMWEYVTVARRAMAACRDHAALQKDLESVKTAVGAMQELLARQQTDMSTTMGRASAALLGNTPWLKGDVAWEAVCRPWHSVMKIHHTFLVVQSLFLKYVALAHFLPQTQQKIYKNHNERIYWLHTVVIRHVIQEYRENHEALERMYRLLKNCGTVDEKKKPGPVITECWLYSEIHTDVARTCIELKIALSRANTLDRFLDSCGVHRSEINLDVLNKDIDILIDDITRSLATAQNSQIRLTNLQGKLKGKESKAEGEEVIEDANVVKIDDKDPEAKDEVFYFVKTEDDAGAPQARDVTTEPGAKEKEASKVVMNELKRKLGKREDVMRERERQALRKTMPGYENDVPEFPRQIDMEVFVERRGFWSKIRREKPRKRLFIQYRIKHRKVKRAFKKPSKCLLLLASDVYTDDIVDELYEANAALKPATAPLSIAKDGTVLIVTKWRKREGDPFSGLSDVPSDFYDYRGLATPQQTPYHNPVPVSHSRHETSTSRNHSELSPSSSEEDLGGRMALLENARKQRKARNLHRAVKNSAGGEEDEGLRPIEYRFGTGMAMASVLQGHKGMASMVQEEVYMGDGEVSDDSGNNDDS